ncbi:MAG: sodium:proton antiporter [Deltaproteobacteria bacterium]|nr:MAG: sodium:proton antiporter [Deltaproteobacteria bacterium]
MKRFSPLRTIPSLCVVGLVLLMPVAGLCSEGEVHEIGKELSLLWVLPFAGLLLSIAIFPLVNPHFWERHYGKVAAAFGAPVAIYFLFKDYHAVLHTAGEYVSFIILLGALFIISGGILIRGTLKGSPLTNSIFILIGSVIANLLGTTGASMLLIRPVIRMNRWRKSFAHVVIFFIFIVSNIGGSLTPIGDPPLFLGFLKGVPFFWTLKHLIHLWAFEVGVVVAVFVVIDTIKYRKDLAKYGYELEGEKIPLKIEGSYNFLLLAAVLGAVFIKPPYREIIMVIASLISIKVTPKSLREENEFTYFPIEEVAKLFAGIFAAMIPALLILKARGGELGVTEPWQFFWATGSLSSFLDNAPTYLTFLSLAQGLGATPEVVGVPAKILMAISAGAVFMGANTYIGNAPNFMVKSIAEENGVKMPSFFGYMLYSLLILEPTFVLVTFLFLR